MAVLSQRQRDREQHAGGPLRAASASGGGSLTGAALRVAETFTTARLRAERLGPAHLAIVRVFHQDEAMMAMIGGCRDEASSRAYLHVHDLHWARHGFGFWLLRDRESDTPVGLGGLRVMPLDGVEELELGYGLLPGWWGRGLATEAATAFLAEAARLGGWASITAVVTPGNEGSERVLAKLGFTLERAYERHDGPTLLYRRGGRPGDPVLAKSGAQ